MKILVFTVTAWNSKVGANTWETLLSQYDSVDIANICIRDEIPDSDTCSRYFVVSESKIIKSLLNRKLKTGRELILEEFTGQINKELVEHEQRYAKHKKNRSYAKLMGRELIWKLGVWKTKELKTIGICG